MAEFLILGAAVGTARLLQSLLVSREEQTPIYTLTPPAFDRIRNGSILTSTPLESFSHQRRRLFTCHYSLNDHSDNLFDVRLHMAPRQASEFHNDFSAHIYLPRSQPGQTLRPLAAAKFHLRHPRDENSFTNFVLRTDVGGNAFVNGAFSITNAIQRMRATPTIVNLTPSQVGSQLGIAVAATPQPPSTYTPLASTPRGVAMFFNLPIFGGTAPNQNAEFKPFEHRPALRMSTVVGMRLDDRTQDGRTGYSLGLHCDPIATLAHAQSGRTDAIQLGGWVSQETDQFRLVAESTIQPLRAGLKVPSGGDGASDSNPAGEGLSHHPVSAALPPRVAASLPALLNSRIGVFYTPARAGQLRPGYEVGFTLANDSKGKQELIASYFHHLVVRRNIKNPFEKKENRAINNYIDLGMEVVYRNEVAAPSAASEARAAMVPPALRFGASWQINKNSLAKFRVADSNVSFLYALKSWWEPSASAAGSIHHSFATNQTTVGVSVSIENIGDVLFSKPDTNYRRMVASQRENVANKMQVDEEY